MFCARRIAFGGLEMGKVQARQISSGPVRPKAQMELLVRNGNVEQLNGRIMRMLRNEGLLAPNKRETRVSLNFVKVRDA